VASRARLRVRSRVMQGRVALVTGASRGVAALARDPEVMRWSGRLAIGAQLGLESGFCDVDGRQPSPLAMGEA
jgi:hypothetical protein